MKYEYIAIKEIDGEIKVVVNEKQKPEYTTARDYPSALEYWKSKHQYISFHSQTEINKVLIHIEKNDVRIYADEIFKDLDNGIEVDCIIIQTACEVCGAIDLPKCSDCVWVNKAFFKPQIKDKDDIVFEKEDLTIDEQTNIMLNEELVKWKGLAYTEGVRADKLQDRLLALDKDKEPTREMKTVYEKCSIADSPENEGWYQTDEGILYYLHGDKKGGWSSREDRMSEEYPKFWYRPIELNLHTNVKVPTDELNKIIKFAETKHLP